jgi:hypothetical protein
VWTLGLKKNLGATRWHRRDFRLQGNVLMQSRMPVLQESSSASTTNRKGSWLVVESTKVQAEHATIRLLRI